MRHKRTQLIGNLSCLIRTESGRNANNQCLPATDLLSQVNLVSRRALGQHIEVWDGVTDLDESAGRGVEGPSVVARDIERQSSDGVGVGAVHDYNWGIYVDVDIDVDIDVDVDGNTLGISQLALTWAAAGTIPYFDVPVSSRQRYVRLHRDGQRPDNALTAIVAIDAIVPRSTKQLRAELQSFTSTSSVSTVCVGGTSLRRPNKSEDLLLLCEHQNSIDFFQTSPRNRMHKKDWPKHQQILYCFFRICTVDSITK
jgi:hypothetical protein